jgi:hypothetical protein
MYQWMMAGLPVEQSGLRGCALPKVTLAYSVTARCFRASLQNGNAENLRRVALFLFGRREVRVRIFAIIGYRGLKSLVRNLSASFTEC